MGGISRSHLNSNAADCSDYCNKRAEISRRRSHLRLRSTENTRRPEFDLSMTLLSVSNIYFYMVLKPYRVYRHLPSRIRFSAYPSIGSWRNLTMCTKAPLAKIPLKSRWRKRDRGEQSGIGGLESQRLCYLLKLLSKDMLFLLFCYALVYLFVYFFYYY